MTIPDWYELALLGLAAWRVFALLAEDSLLDRPRKYLTKGRDELALFIECPYCAGFWIGLAWWGAFQIYEFGTLLVASIFALSALVVAAHKVLADD